MQSNHFSYLLIWIASVTFSGGVHARTMLEPGMSAKENRLMLQQAIDNTEYGGEIVLRRGTYEIDTPLRIRHSIALLAAEGEKVILSGGRQFTPPWSANKRGAMQASIPEDIDLGTVAFDQLYLNGVRLHLARYPNHSSTERFFGGTSEDALSPQRINSWKDPSGGFVHSLHRSKWGGNHWRIVGKNADGTLKLEGGWMNNRPSGINPKLRFVENIGEEFDAPGEWYLDREARSLHVYPPSSVDITKAKMIVSGIERLVEVVGETPDEPVGNVRLEGITFAHTARTFMQTNEPLLRSDWMIHRGGAVFIENAQNVELRNCDFLALGGTGVFVSGHAEKIVVVGSHFRDLGASGVCFVGKPTAVRSPSFNYRKFVPLDLLDRDPGPKSEDYPRDCRVEDCLIHDIGTTEKQVAGVQIAMAARITVRHVSIYDTPRAGINIGDGTWGGHLIEGCDVFDTVQMTGDHGSFNSWGRDRFWHPKRDTMIQIVTDHPELPRLDAVETTVIRNSRWRCDHGWDIDLDDGSSNYEIFNNLCLNGGIKLREGFHRNVYNNVMVNNSFHPHVWFGNCKDEFCRNIVFEPYKPRIMKHRTWGKALDYNLQHSTTESGPAAVLSRMSGRDEHSRVGNARFVDPANGDYRVTTNSIAKTLGFENFAMDQFGVQHARLRALARTPVLPTQSDTKKTSSNRDQRIVSWFGAKIKNIVGLGDVSAAGLPSESGARLVDVPAGSKAAQAGLQVDDVVLKCDGRRIDNVDDLRRQSVLSSGTIALEVWRNQKAMTVDVPDAPTAGLDGINVAMESTVTPSFGRIKSVSKTDLAQGIVPSANSSTRNERLATLTDGEMAQNYGPVFPNGIRNGMYRLDLGSSKEISEINTYSAAIGNRGHQVFSVFGSTSQDDPGYAVWDSETFTLIGTVDTRSETSAEYIATSLSGRIGSFRWLVWVTEPVNGKENTAFQEFDVMGAGSK